MRTPNKKSITALISVLSLILILSTITYARPFTDAFKGGLLQVNDFFGEEQYKPYSKVIDFFFFSLLFIAVYMMGARYAFKEMKRPETLIVILLGLMSAFLMVLGGFSATVLLPYIHWLLYALLFILYWHLLKGIKNKFWRFVLALLLTLLTIALLQGLFEGLTAPEIAAPTFLKDFGGAFKGIQFPELGGPPGVPDWLRDLYAPPTIAPTGPETAPTVPTPTEPTAKPWYKKVGPWIGIIFGLVLLVLLVLAAPRLLRERGERERRAAPTTLAQEIGEIITKKRSSKDEIVRFANEKNQIIGRITAAGETQQAFHN